MQLGGPWHTAAEVIAERWTATKPFMGLQTTRPSGIRAQSTYLSAKNYLSADELQVLKPVIVALYTIIGRSSMALERKADDRCETGIQEAG